MGTLDKARNILRSVTVLRALLLFALYWLFAGFVEPFYLNQVMSYLLIGVSVAVCISYMPNVLATLQEEGPPDRVGQLTMGIVLGFAGLTLNRMWAIGIRVFELDWMRTSPVIGFYVWMGILAGILHITAPGAIQGRIPSRNWVLVGVATGIGLLLSGIFIGLQLGLEILEPLQR